MAGKSTRSKRLSGPKAEGDVCHQEPQPFSIAIRDLREGRKNAALSIVEVWKTDEALQKQHHALRVLCQKQRGRRLLPPSDALPPLP